MNGRSRTFTHILFILLLLSPLMATAQEESKRDLVQFSGVVVKSDSLTPIPYTTIIIKNNKSGTTADNNGYFSFVAKENDTILFSAIGFEQNSFIIPDSLNDHKYSLIHVMESDTVDLKETVVHPWPSRDQFKEAFLNLDIPDDDIQRARENLADNKLQEMRQNIAMDGAMNFNYEMQQHQNKLYYAGQTPPIQLLNPAAWAKFIEAWRNGEFKNEE